MIVVQLGDICNGNQFNEVYSGFRGRNQTSENQLEFVPSREYNTINITKKQLIDNKTNKFD